MSLVNSWLAIVLFQILRHSGGSVMAIWSDWFRRFFLFNQASLGEANQLAEPVIEEAKIMEKMKVELEQFQEAKKKIGVRETVLLLAWIPLEIIATDVSWFPGIQTDLRTCDNQAVKSSIISRLQKEATSAKELFLAFFFTQEADFFNRALAEASCFDDLTFFLEGFARYVCSVEQLSELRALAKKFWDDEMPVNEEIEES